MKQLGLTACVVLTIVVFGGACSDSSDGEILSTPTSGLTVAAMTQIAVETNELASGLLGERVEIIIPAVAPGGTVGEGIELPFEGRRACPEGGEIAIVGNLLVDLTPPPDFALDVTFVGTNTLIDCALAWEEGTVVVNGETTLELSLSLDVDGLHGGEFASYRGSLVAVRSDGEERRCDFDITIARDGETLTVSGTVCGDSVGGVD